MVICRMQALHVHIFCIVGRGQQMKNNLPYLPIHKKGGLRIL